MYPPISLLGRLSPAIFPSEIHSPIRVAFHSKTRETHQDVSIAKDWV